MTTDAGSAYHAAALAQVPRILGLGDREPTSRTFGCFDRTYWHYAGIDFANARFQEVAALLALLHQHDVPGNLLFHRPAVAEWVRAATRFWTDGRNRDGSVSEAYPRERSFCATAFGFAAVTQAHLLLDLEAPVSWGATAAWLARADNADAANQVAAAAHALANWGTLTGDRAWLERAGEKAATVCARQDREGWFPEYGGPDVGYQTLTIGQLVRYQRRARDARVSDVLARAVAFVEDAIREDGRHDADAGSRRTQFAYPFGLVTLGASCASRHARGVAEGRALNPGWLDDRYVVQLTADFFEAGLAASAPCA